jgi:hypothetical protein
MRRAGAREAPGLGDDLKRGEEVHDPIELLERVVVDDIHTEARGYREDEGAEARSAATGGGQTRRWRRRREEDEKERFAGGGDDGRSRLGLVGCGGGGGPVSS